MSESILEYLEDWGVWGVLLSLFIEGSAFPFIGTFFIVTVGFLLDLSWLETAWISVLGSFLYTVGSYIPYFIGLKLEHVFVSRLSLAKREKLEKAKAAFSKYGVWNVAISSPLHLGNVVPFLAGMSSMGLFRYTLLTMLGIAPSTFLFLSVGRFYTGDTVTLIDTIMKYQSLVLIGFVFLTALYVTWKVIAYRRKKAGIMECNRLPAD